MAVSNPSGLTISNPQTGIQFTKVTDNSNDWVNVAVNTYFYDIASAQTYYKNIDGAILNTYSQISNYGIVFAQTNFNFLT